MKNKKNRLVGLVLTLVMVFSMMPVSSMVVLAEESPYSYDDETKTLTFTGSGELTYEVVSGAISLHYDATKVVISGYSSIGEYAFSGCSRLTDITIPDSVTFIGGYAFSGCLGLANEDKLVIVRNVVYDCKSDVTTVTIPSTVTKIEDNAFYACSNLGEINVAEGNTNYKSIDGVLYNIAGTALIHCPQTKTTVTIPNSVTSIPDGAFFGCSALTNITLSNNVSTIGDSTFSGCTSLTSIIIPNSVTSIGDYAFFECAGLTSVTISDSVKTIGERAFAGCESLTSITIPGSVTTIGEAAFEDCEELDNVTIQNGVKIIGDKAFESCYELTSITIPDSVTAIGAEAFEDCEKLSSITIPNKVTTIGERTFSGCEGLTSIIIPNSVTTIGDQAFYGCEGLTSITIPNSVKTIGFQAFDDCIALTSVTIPSSVTTIGEGAFSDCIGLTSVIISDGVTTIKNNAFYCCGKLSSITFDSSTLPTIGDNAFAGLKDSGVFKVPAGTTQAEKNKLSGKGVDIAATAGDDVWTITEYSSGRVEVPTNKQADNFESAGLVNTTAELMDAVLTDEEKAAVKYGKSAAVWVEVKDVSDTVNDEDKAKIEDKIQDDYDVAIYIDINLWKQISGSDATKVTEVPNGKVKIGFKIPEDLRKAGRTYKIIRVHNGVATIIEAEVDEDFNVTFETDEFSTYALIYEEKAADTSATAPNTGDNNSIYLYALLMMAGLALAGAGLYYKRRDLI